MRRMEIKNDGRCDYCDAEISKYAKSCPECGRIQIEMIRAKRNWTDWDSENEDNRAEEASEKAGIGEIAEPAVIAQRLSKYLISALPLFALVNILIVAIGALFVFVLNALNGTQFIPSYSYDLSGGIGAILMWGGGAMVAVSGWASTYRSQGVTASAPYLWSKTSSATKMSILKDFQIQQSHWIIMGVYSLIITIIGMMMQ